MSFCSLLLYLNRPWVSFFCDITVRGFFWTLACLTAVDSYYDWTLHQEESLCLSLSLSCTDDRGFKGRTGDGIVTDEGRLLITGAIFKRKQESEERGTMK
jgi:hypothetical protein